MKRIAIILSSLALLTFGGCSALDDGQQGAALLCASLPDTAPGTRSTLPVTAEFENTVREVTFISYDAGSGLLEGAVYASGTSASLSLNLHSTHHIYCLANMGDYSAVAPTNETAMRNISYTIPSFTGMASSGMPMAGMTESSGSGPVSVSVRRLLAKVKITVDRSDICDWNSIEPFSFSDLQVEHVARRLYPFAVGGSRARSADDLFSTAQEYEDMTDVDVWESLSDERVLYIPENCQGVLLAGNANMMDKSLSNPELSSQENIALCTYITFNGYKYDGDGVGGDLCYRFFPGGDATQNFSLQGGRIYNISLLLSWNGMFTQGNWMVTRSGWNDNRLLQVSDDETAGYGSSFNLTLPAGLSDYSIFVYYCPWGDPFDVSNPGHTEGPYGFSIGSAEADNSWDYLEDDDHVVVYYDESLTYCSSFRISIPQDDALWGTTRQIAFFTREKQHMAVCNLTIVQPTIVIDQAEVVKGPAEYGSSGIFYVTVIGGSVPKNEISVQSSSADLRVIEYESGTGRAKICWLSANNTSARRSATLTFSGLGASAACTAYQNGRSAFDIGGDDDGGEGYNNY